jgi:crotonobetaine/carnitine-CoA ligase
MEGGWPGRAGQQDFVPHLLRHSLLSDALYGHTTIVTMKRHGYRLKMNLKVNKSSADTIGKWIADKADLNGDAVALDIMGVEKTYADIHLDTNRLATGLLALGLKPGDHASLMMKNSLSNVDVWFAMCKAGIVEVPINTAYRGQLLQYIIQHSKSKAIFIDEEYLGYLAVILPQLPELRHIIINREVTDKTPEYSVNVITHDLSEIYSNTTLHLPNIRNTDTSVLLYTSGTTGPSKGVMLCHEANLSLTRHTRRLVGYDHSDVLYTMFPLFHINAKYTSLMCAMEANAKVVIDQRFSASQFWATCRAKGITAFNYQGGMLKMLWKQPEREDDSDNLVKNAFGAPCPIDIWEPFEKRFGLLLTEVYGMTEASIVTENPKSHRKIGTAGRESENYSVIIADENDNPLPANTPGEILIRPKTPSIIFKEYFGMPEKTLAAFRNLWFHSGDRGRMDEDGYLTFVDRIKDCIRRRGENISSYEVELVINSYDSVLESAAYGVPSDIGEEEVMVAIVMKPATVLKEVELLDFCQEKMAHFSVPRYIVQVNSLPRTPSQRIEKFKLREIGITDSTWDRDTSSFILKR